MCGWQWSIDLQCFENLRGVLCVAAAESETSFKMVLIFFLSSFLTVTTAAMLKAPVNLNRCSARSNNLYALSFVVELREMPQYVQNVLDGSNDYR